MNNINSLIMVPTKLLDTGVESPLIFYTKKKLRKNKYNYIFKIHQMSLIE